MDKYNQHWVSAIFNQSEWAITLFGTTYYSVAQADVDAAWRRHEDCHKEQQRLEGFMFYPRYLWYAMTKGYDLNPYEVEARSAVK